MDSFNDDIGIELDVAAHIYIRNSYKCQKNVNCKIEMFIYLDEIVDMG